jgi:hypothetical protein
MVGSTDKSKNKDKALKDGSISKVRQVAYEFLQRQETLKVK